MPAVSKKKPSKREQRGARIRISTNTPEAVKAIHKFLRFQIKDHQTGDSGEIEN
jgi:TusA-related sulfurtransferase